jgi:hypothetical protein
MMATISLPAFSGRAATLSAAKTAAPELMPTKSLLRAAAARRGDGFVVGDLDDFVDQLGVQDRWHKACADALNLVRAGFAAAEDRAVGGFDGNSLETGLALLDIAGYAGQGAARADAGDEKSTLPAVSFQISGPVVA